MNKLKAWFFASRPKTLTASLVPILIATALAYGEGYEVDWRLSLWAFFAACFVQIGTNFINDALDFRKGADDEKRVGPKRIIQQGLATPKEVLAAGFIALSLALLFGIPLVVKAGLPIFILLLVSVALAYLYTGGPYPLAYKGLGDLFVFLFFGLASTTAVYYILTGFWNVKALLAGAQIGLLATVLIAINNLRDIEGDAKVDKKTMAVRFGILFSRIEITILLFLPFLLGFYWKGFGYDLASWLPVLMLPMAGRIGRNVWQTPPGPKYNQFLAESALLQLLFALVLALCIII